MQGNFLRNFYQKELKMAFLGYTLDFGQLLTIALLNTLKKYLNHGKFQRFLIFFQKMTFQ